MMVKTEEPLKKLEKEKFIIRMNESELFQEYGYLLDREQSKDIDGHGYVLDCHKRTADNLIDVLEKNDIKVIRYKNDFYVDDEFEVFLLADGEKVTSSKLPLEVRIKFAEKEVVQNNQVLKDERGQSR